MQKLLNFIKHPTSRDIIINTFGNYLNVAFTAFFAIILWQIMQPSQYGVLSVLLAIAYVLTNILDFGTTATIYSSIPHLYDQKSFRLYPFIKSTFFYQTIFSICVILLLFITFPYLDKYFFKTDAPPLELYLTAISVLFFIWQNSILNIMFAAKKFVKANIYLNISNVIKTLVLFYFILSDRISVGSIMFIFGIVGPSVLFLYLFIEKKGLFNIILKSEVRREEFRFEYTMTYFLASQFYNLGLRMDLFLLSYFGMKEEVGYYGISQKIILTIITTIISITQVISPRFSRIQNANARTTLKELKGGFMYLLIPSALFIVLFFLPEQIYALAFRKENIKEAVPYIASITRSLSLPFILNAIGSIPQLYLLYTIKKPRYILVANVVFFLIVSIGCYILIPQYGVYAPSYAISVGFIVSIFMLTVASLYEYRLQHHPQKT